MDKNKPGLSRGERAPDFVLPLHTGTPTRFYAIAGGKPTVLLFCSDDDMDALPSFSEALSEQAPDNMSIIAVKNENTKSESADALSHELSFPLFTDTQGKLRKAYRLNDGEQTIVFVLDTNLRVLEAFPLQEAVSSATQVKAVFDASLPPITPLRISTQAPVLLIPNVLDAEICENLIDVWEKHGSVETGVEQSQDGHRKETIRHDHKRRRDHVVMDAELLKFLTSAIGRRVMPEVQKSFAFRATRFEGFKIVCYDAAAGGFFHAHRDNLSPTTAHRRFALTLNLNGDYDGGDLRFPEYSPHLYSPEKGDALVFSCSHLHEVTNVSKGRRFALLSFLFSEKDVRPQQSK